MSGNSELHNAERVYTQLGAPALLYRNKDCYTVQDHPIASSMVPKEDAHELHQLLSSRQRVRGFWYYPDMEPFRKNAKHSQDESSRHDSSESERDALSVNERDGRLAKMAERIAWNADEAMEQLTKQDERDPTSEQVIDIRTQLLIQSGVQEPKNRLARKLKRLQNFESKTVLRNDIQGLDDRNIQSSTRKKWDGEQMANIAYGQREAIMDSDPAYMAPIQEGLLEWALDDNKTGGTYNSDTDSQAQVSSQEDDGSESDQSCDVPKRSSSSGSLEEPYEDSKRRTTRNANVSTDVESAFENRMGNCIACFSCFCRYCLDNSQSRSLWILHPVGPFLDRMRISLIRFPFNEVCDYRGRHFPSRHEVTLGERVWQLCQCASNKYVARTASKCFLLEICIEEVGHNASFTGCRGSFLTLTILCAVDLSINSASPRFLASHPKYGGKFTDPKVAVIYGSNIINLVDFGLEPRVSKHTIANLQNISLVEFQRSHPMMLWSAAQSFIRNTVNNKMIGHGHSLYSIDLRTNRGSVFWSPSRLEFLAEGSFSISGIICDWEKPNRLFVSSTSAKRTWELDTRMPPKVVNSWHLPHACEGVAGRATVSGFQGTNFVFCHQDRNEKRKMPLFGVNTAPGSFGVHLYQRACRQPYLDTLSFECANVCQSSKVEVEAIASSSIFALPDVSPGIFCCGLSSFRTSTDCHLRKLLPGSLADQSSLILLTTATNKGDLYIHHLVESNAPLDTDINPSSQMVGTNSQAIVEERSNLASTARIGTKRISNDKPIMAGLDIILSNNFPIPHDSVMKTNKLEGTRTFSHVTLIKTQNKQASSEARSSTEKFSVPINPLVPFPAQIVRSQGNDGDLSSKLPRQVFLSRELMNDALDAQESTTDCFQSAEHDFDPNFSQGGDAAYDIADAKALWEDASVAETDVMDHEPRESLVQADENRWKVQQKMAKNQDPFSSDSDEYSSDTPPYEWAEDDEFVGEVANVERETKEKDFGDEDDKAAGRLLTGHGEANELLDNGAERTYNSDDGRYSDTDEEGSYY